MFIHVKIKKKRLDIRKIKEKNKVNELEDHSVTDRRDKDYSLSVVSKSKIVVLTIDILKVSKKILTFQGEMRIKSLKISIYSQP